MPYQHEPTTGKLDVSSEESSEEDDESNKRLANMDWYIIAIYCTPIISPVFYVYIGATMVTVKLCHQEKNAFAAVKLLEW